MDITVVKTFCDVSPLDCETTYTFGGLAFAMGIHWLIKDTKEESE